MNHYCRKCNVNWSELHTDEVGDEKYEFCPICKSDMDLVHHDLPGSSYVMSPISGEIRNAETGKKASLKTPGIVLKPIEVKTYDDFLAALNERIRLEDERIEAYRKQFD